MWLRREMLTGMPGRQLENQAELQPGRRIYRFFDASWPEELQHFPTVHGVVCHYSEEAVPELIDDDGAPINARIPRICRTPSMGWACSKATRLTSGQSSRWVGGNRTLAHHTRSSRENVTLGPRLRYFSRQATSYVRAGEEITL